MKWVYVLISTMEKRKRTTTTGKKKKLKATRQVVCHASATSYLPQNVLSIEKNRFSYYGGPKKNITTD